MAPKLPLSPADRPTRFPVRRAPLVSASILVVVSALSGCSSIPWLGGEKDPTPPTKLVDLVPETSIQTLWSVRPTKGTMGRQLNLVPAVGGGRVYVAGADGRVAAVDAENGRTLWERETSLPYSAGPDLAGDRLLLGTSGGQAVTLSATDGHQIWSTQVGSEILGVPRDTGDGKVIVHALDDTVYALDSATGKELWRVSYPPPVLTLRGSSTPKPVSGGIVVGLSGGKLVKLDPKDGAPLWEVLITAPSGRSDLARIADIDAEPVAVGSILFVGTYNGDLAAVDIPGGAVLWRRQLSSYAGLAASENDLFVTDSEDRIWAADPASGAGRWKQERLRYRRLTAPTPIGNMIAVGDLEGWVHLIAQDDGRLVGRVRITKAPIEAAPVAAGGRLYVYALDGTLAALTVGRAPPGGGHSESGRSAEAGDKAAIAAQGGSVTAAGALAPIAPGSTPSPPSPPPSAPNSAPAVGH